MIGPKNRFKRKVHYVVERGYWDGFFACLEGGGLPPLEYGSDSGLYSLNEIRKIAEKAGYDFCEAVLAERWKRQTNRRYLPQMIDREIPGRVWADAYGAAGIAAVK